MNKYLKLIIPIVFLLFALPLYAEDGVDWAIFDDYNNNIEYYALYKAIHGIPIKYNLYDDSPEIVVREKMKKDPLQQLGAQLIDYAKGQELSVIVEKAFNTWFEDTLKMIKESGRSAEFWLFLPRFVGCGDMECLFLFCLLSPRLLIFCFMERLQNWNIFLFQQANHVRVKKQSLFLLNLFFYKLVAWI